MNPTILFFLVLVGAPLVELYFLIEVGRVIGALPTLLLSLFTAALGAWLVRMQGLSVLFRVQRVLARGEAPALEMVEGALLLLAGLVLLFPGFVTDAMGFVLLVPPLRRALVVGWLRRSGVLRPPAAATGGDERPSLSVIEGEFHREEGPKDPGSSP